MERRPMVWIFAACLFGMLISYIEAGRYALFTVVFLFYLVLLVLFFSLRKSRRYFVRDNSKNVKSQRINSKRADLKEFNLKIINLNMVNARVVLMLVLPIAALAGFFRMDMALLPGVLEGGGFESVDLGNGRWEAFGLNEGKDVKVIGRVRKMQPQGEGLGIFLSEPVVFFEGRGITCEDILVYSGDASLGGTLKHGTLLQARGTLRTLEEPSNPGQFNQKLYYKSQGIFYRMTGNDISDIGMGSIGRFEYMGYGLRQCLYDFKVRLERVYDKLLNEKDAGFIKAMVLGNKSGMDKDRKSLFQKNGIAHILAISGMHLSILSGILMWIFKRAGFHRKPGCVLSLFILLCYGIMTGEGISTLRAFLMSGMSVLAILTGRSYDMPTAASLSAIVILFRSPLCLTQPGFLLSYGAIFGIAVLYTTYTEQTEIRWDRSGRRNIKWSARIPYRWRGFINSLSVKAGDSLVFSFFIQVSLLPVMLFCYHEVFLGGIILNLLVIPLLPFLFVCGILGGILGMFLSPAGKFFLLFVHIIFMIYEKGCRLLMEADRLYLTTGEPSVLQFMFYALVVFLFLFICRLLKKKWTVAFLLFTFVLFVPLSGGDCWITFLDVGQGDCIVMGAGRNEICLVDGGSSSVKDVGTYRILPFLKYKGVSRIDYWFVTHGDEDHYSGVLELLEMQKMEHLKIKTLVLPSLDYEDEGLKELEEAAVLNGTKVFRIRPGQRIEGSYSLSCIYPESENSKHPGEGKTAGSGICGKNEPVESGTVDKNSNSLVLYWDCKSISGIFTGDMDISGENELCSAGRIKDVTFLKVGHHGSRGSTGEGFLKALSPEISIISCGKKNRYGHPHEELLERLKEIGTEIFRTDEAGAVMVETDGERMKVTSIMEAGNASVYDEFVNKLLNLSETIMAVLQK